MKVLAAMSGGVDSAVAAARMVDAGHDVVGVHLALSRTPAGRREGARGCCTVEDAGDARRAADVMGIPFYVWDMAERFQAQVIDDFVAEYAASRTPNPCVRCNQHIKFAALLDKALALDFDAVCTGHYARTVPDARGGKVPQLTRAVDPGKDQSYVLGVLTADQLRHALFPLGDTPKDEVRLEAQRRGLSVADKPDSHDICFIADGDTRGFLAKRLGTTEGAIVDRAGAEVGRHQGAHSYTVGQRRGLALGYPAADGKPRFVLEVQPVTNTVVVGPRAALSVSAVHADGLTWCLPQPLAGAHQVLVQIRAHGEAFPATVEPDDRGGLSVRLRDPIEGVAPGQTVVMYRGDQVLGSATISTTTAAPHD